MKFSSIVLAAAACSPVVLGASIKNARAEANAQKMERLMNLKTAQRQQQQLLGLFEGSATYKTYSARQPCTAGKAGSGSTDTYSCDKVDLLSFTPHDQLGSSTKEGNDIWGWTSPEGREFAAIGQTDGTAFAEILKDGTIDYIGRLPSQTVSSIWRDMKVIKGYAYIGSEAQGHGLQVFDMRKLLTAKAKNGGKAKTFSTLTDLTAWFNGFGSSHNIVAHEETNMIYAVGTSRNLACAGGLFMVDVSNPAKPKNAGCVADDGYVHDAQCVIYSGPDAAYKGREVCFNYNEDTLTIVDVTNKKTPKTISRTPYTGSAYTHQGWLLDSKQDILLADDELDELDGTQQGAKNFTTTYIWDIKSLSKPIQTGIYQSPEKSIDHNQYTLNGLSYQSNYMSGLRIVDVTSRDLSGKNFRQAGFFDVHPEDDATGGEVEFAGAWSVYPYFKSGNLVVNSIERGLFVLKYTG